MMGFVPKYSMLSSMSDELFAVERCPLLDTMAFHGSSIAQYGGADVDRKILAALLSRQEEEGRRGAGGGEAVLAEAAIGGKKINRLTAEQVRVLEASFAQEPRLTTERKLELAEQLGLQPRQVAVWYQNRKQRSKIKQLELDYSCLSSDYRSLIAETERLKTQVARLTKELESAKRGKREVDGLTPKCALWKGHLIGAQSNEHVPSHGHTATTVNQLQQFYPTYSAYSAVVDSEDSNSMNYIYGCSFDFNNIDNLVLSSHESLATSTHVNVHSVDHVGLGYAFPINHNNYAAMDSLWSS